VITPPTPTPQRPIILILAISDITLWFARGGILQKRRLQYYWTSLEYGVSLPKQKTQDSLFITINHISSHKAQPRTATGSLDI
jgi:hypothetical protein